ncbi:Transcriptional adapter ada2, partial [Ascosphaera acerosa]
GDAALQPLPGITPWDLASSPPPPPPSASSQPATTNGHTHGHGHGTGSSNASNAPRPPDQQLVPDLQLLTPEEVMLCNILHIQPKPYLVIKEQLIKEAMRNGGVLKRKDIKQVLGDGLDPAKGARIWEFMVMSGWVAKG